MSKNQYNKITITKNVNKLSSVRSTDWKSSFSNLQKFSFNFLHSSHASQVSVSMLGNLRKISGDHDLLKSPKDSENLSETFRRFHSLYERSLMMFGNFRQTSVDLERATILSPAGRAKIWVTAKTRRRGDETAISLSSPILQWSVLYSWLPPFYMS